MVTYSRPTNDIALLLVSSVPADLRREHTDELLDLYWQKLTTISKKLKVDIEDTLQYTRAKLGEDFKKGQLLALLLCIGKCYLLIKQKISDCKKLPVHWKSFKKIVMIKHMHLETNQKKIQRLLSSLLISLG